MSDVREELQLAEFIREIDGDNKIGASQLAEKILDWQAARAQGGEAVAAVNKASTGEYEFYPASGLVDMPNGIHKLFAQPPAQDLNRSDPVAWVGTHKDRITGFFESEKDARDSFGFDGCRVQPLYTHPAPKITPAMIEAGAQRLVRWDENSTWPDSWSAIDVAAARQDAERVIRSALSVMGGDDD